MKTTQSFWGKANLPVCRDICSVSLTSQVNDIRRGEMEPIFRLIHETRSEGILSPELSMRMRAACRASHDRNDGPYGNSEGVREQAAALPINGRAVLPRRADFMAQVAFRIPSRADLRTTENETPFLGGDKGKFAVPSQTQKSKSRLSAQLIPIQKVTERGDV